MAWETEFTGTSPNGQRVDYQTRARLGWSRAERPDRVKVSGQVVHTGWVSNHRGYEVYQQYAWGRVCVCTHGDDCPEHGTDSSAHHDPADHVWE